MSPEWRLRPYKPPAVINSPDFHVPACTIDINDHVILRLTEQPDVDICVRVTTILPEGQMQGVIARAPARGAGGDGRFVPGAAVAFDTTQVFRLERGT